MDAGLVAQHDLLLSMKPDAVEHDSDACLICAEKASSADNHDHPGGGSVSDKTFTEAELQAAVDKAIAEATQPLQAKVSELENSQQQSEVDKAISAVTAEKDEVIADLQAKLDAAVIEVTQKGEAYAELEKFWTDAIAEKEETDAREARRDERLAKLAEEAGFPEEYLKENEERFVAMADEEFAARLEEYKALAAKNGTPKGTGVPVSTALKAARENASNKSETSALHEVLSLRNKGVDLRTIRS